MSTQPGSVDEREVVIQRLIDAPPARLFLAWTDRDAVAHWWRPSGFERVDCEKMDAPVGGGFRFRMLFRDGTVHMSTNVYRELVEPERIVYDETCDENGKPFHKARLAVTFEDQAGATRLTIRARLEWVEGRDPRWTPDLMRQGLAAGWNDNLDLLERYLEKIGAAATEV